MPTLQKEPPVGAKAQPGSNVEKPGLLVVEDQNTTRQSLAIGLRREGYFVRVAREGVRAVSLAAEPSISLVLMDIDLPGELDGLEAACRIRLAHPEKGIIFVTAFYDRDEYRRRAAQLGLHDIEWVTKPTTNPQVNALFDTIRRVTREIEKRRIRRALDIGTRWISRGQMLDLLGKWNPEVGKEVVRDMQGEVAAARTDLIAELRAELIQVSSILARNPHDVQELQMAFGPFKDKVLGRMWTLYEEADQNHQRVAVKLRSAVRKLCSLDFEEKHVVALRFVIDKLAQQVVTEEEIWDCERMLRYQDVETLLDLGPYREELLQIYRQASEVDEDQA